ncbi:MAG: ribosome maturation factor RimM [Gammaproteobacteria bacterium]
MTSGKNQSEQVVLGKIGKTYGIKGWLRINSFTSPPENILEYESLGVSLGETTRTVRIDQSKQQNNKLLVHFDGIDDPETAQELTGANLWVDAAALPVLEAGSYYWHELQGMLVVNQQQELLGKVDSLLETGANDVLVVAPTKDSIDTRERLIPYLREKVVQEVDKEANQIKVDWEASYLS